MPRQKLSNTEFLALIKPLLDDETRGNPPTLKELAKATGLSEGGVYYKLKACGIGRKSEYVQPAA